MKEFFSHAYKKTSQNKEDGILDYIFKEVGFTNKKGLELCCGSGIQCNLTNLIHNHKLDCLYFDKSDKKIAKGENYWADKEHSPIYINDYITFDNLQNYITGYDFDGDIDILSLDMDGIDYWIMRSLKEYLSPRVIVLEFQDILGAELCWTVPYKEKFSGWNKYAKGGPNYSGASLRAFVNLLDNYNLVGIEEKGFNAFFIRKDVSHNIPVVKNLNLCFDYRSPEKIKKLHDRLDIVKDLDWCIV
tara:strand:- start:490 stop:1224 length:735 start_codon:yes stop_codon:yes gene_type:complete